MSEEKKQKYVDPNKFADYGEAMKPVANDRMAVEWQKSDESKLAEATKSDVLAGYVKDEKSAAALLAKIQGAYKTNPVTLSVIGAVSQFVMEPANGHAAPCGKLCMNHSKGICRRRTWNTAIIEAFRKTKDEYIQTFLLDQFRWCGCKTRVDEVRALKANAASDNVRKYIDWTLTELTWRP